MLTSLLRPAPQAKGFWQRGYSQRISTGTAPFLKLNKRLLVAKVADDAAPNPSDEHHLTADTILWNAQHSYVLRKRIAQVRAAEVAAESSSSRPELPLVIGSEVEDNHSRLCQWHEDQWQRLGATQHNPWEDHFGNPS